MSFRKIIQTDNAPKAVGTYSQGVEHNGIFYFSGQVGLEPKSGKLHEDFDSQLKQVMKNIDGLLEAASTNRSKIIKTTIFLVDLNDFDKVNKAYIEFFEAPFPARSTVEVSALPKGALVEIEVIAAK